MNPTLQGYASAILEAAGSSGGDALATLAADLESIEQLVLSNAPLNAALTDTTMAEICRFPATRTLAAHMMMEAAEVAAKLGLHLRLSIDQRIAGAEKVGDHKTSMLQDVEAGRALEIDPLVGSFVELGQLTDTPMPATEAVYALVSLLDARLRQGAR